VKVIPRFQLTSLTQVALQDDDFLLNGIRISSDFLQFVFSIVRLLQFLTKTLRSRVRIVGFRARRPDIFDQGRRAS